MGDGVLSRVLDRVQSNESSTECRFLSLTLLLTLTLSFNGP